MGAKPTFPKLDAGACIPIDVDLYGYSKAKIDPLPADIITEDRSVVARVVLTPDKPTVEIEMAGGRRVYIHAWANKSGIGPACRHDARAQKIEDALERLYEWARDAKHYLELADNFLESRDIRASIRSHVESFDSIFIEQGDK